MQNKLFSPSWHQPSGSDPDMSAFKRKALSPPLCWYFHTRTEPGWYKQAEYEEGTLQAQNGRLDAFATHIWKSLGSRLSISSEEEYNYICGHKTGNTRLIAAVNVNVSTQLGHTKSKQHGYVTRPYQSRRLSLIGMLIHGEQVIHLH